eukprot:3625204-Prymnesium_polylepis.1
MAAQAAHTERIGDIASAHVQFARGRALGARRADTDSHAQPHARHADTLRHAVCTSRQRYAGPVQPTPPMEPESVRIVQGAPREPDRPPQQAAAGLVAFITLALRGEFGDPGALLAASENSFATIVMMFSTCVPA